MSGYIGSKRSSSLVSATEITLDGAKLKSSGDSITKSDGTTAVLSESSGTVTFTTNTAVIEGSSSGDLVRITQTGSGNALVVEDSANPDSTPFVVTNDGKVGIGRTIPNELLSIGNSSGQVSIFLASGATNQGYISYFNSSQTLSLGNAAPTGTGVNGGQQLNILASGNVGIGTTSPSYQLQLSTDSAGKPSTNTWTVVSDERIKEQIELADLDLCYDAVKNIPLKRFKWKDEVYSEEQVADRHKLGWIAQDVESVYPKAVNIHEFRYNQVYNETIIPAVEEELDEEGNVITEAQEERTEKELVSEDVMEDCRNLNADQIYAAMYGAIQKLIQKVESQQSQIDTLTVKTQEQDLTIASLISRIEALETQPT